MGRPKNRKSRYSMYKTTVKYFLCGIYKWNPYNALLLLNKKSEVVRDLLAQEKLPSEAAGIINERFKGHAQS